MFRIDFPEGLYVFFRERVRGQIGQPLPVTEAGDDVGGLIPGGACGGGEIKGNTKREEGDEKQKGNIE